ncbi:transposase [Streptomyces sp. MAR25Y5]|uniref:transposase n=1 Tax=Streptomyces sp. MAR25Y5 TaxID=2962028 RepID=UPI0020B79146|nr:transposase [Streptomyces sp. MAR25Y5]MCP3770141.1 transposase [Streptomyces sp. MAR25Y5]
MSDAEWALVRDLLPVPAWVAGRGSRPEDYRHRQMIDAVRYLVDNGIKWPAMPADSPPWPRVYAFFPPLARCESGGRAARPAAGRRAAGGGP